MLYNIGLKQKFIAFFIYRPLENTMNFCSNQILECAKINRGYTVI